VVHNMRYKRIMLLVMARCHDVSSGRHTCLSMAHKSNSGLMRFVIIYAKEGQPRDLQRDKEQIV
jgi:hypothetical protein